MKGELIYMTRAWDKEISCRFITHLSLCFHNQENITRHGLLSNYAMNLSASLNIKQCPNSSHKDQMLVSQFETCHHSVITESSFN